MLGPASLSVQVGCAMCQQTMQKQVLAFHEVRIKCRSSFPGAATQGGEGGEEGPVVDFPLTSLLPQGGLGSSGESVQQRDTQPPVPRMLVRGLAVVGDPGELKIPRGGPSLAHPVSFLICSGPLGNQPMSPPGLSHSRRVTLPSCLPPCRPGNARSAPSCVSSAGQPCASASWRSMSTTAATAQSCAWTAASPSCSARWPSTGMPARASRPSARQVSRAGASWTGCEESGHSTGQVPCVDDGCAGLKSIWLF